MATLAEIMKQYVGHAVQLACIPMRVEGVLREVDMENQIAYIVSPGHLGDEHAWHPIKDLIGFKLVRRSASQRDRYEQWVREHVDADHAEASIAMARATELPDPEEAS